MHLSNHFKPLWWLNSAHLQTIFPVTLRRKIKLNPSRERLELPDGDYLDIDWVGDNEDDIVLVLHGLAGSIDSPYARGLLLSLRNSGCKAALMHFRGCSGEINRLPRSYHAGETDDLDYVMATLKNRYPRARLSAVGFSLGGNVLLKWLGENNDHPLINAAVAVSVPFDLKNVVNRLQTGFSKIYQWHLLNQLKNEVLRKKQLLAPWVKVEEIHKIKNFQAFDELITAPLYGFNNADDYYCSSSCKPFLKNINVPTLIIHAVDDPFMSPDCLPASEELSEKITFELYPSGGHVGFISAAKLAAPSYWLEQRIPSYLSSVKNYPSLAPLNASGELITI